MKTGALILICCSVFLFACDSSNDADSEARLDVNPAAVNSADDTGRGASIYKSKCFACHGTGAAGAPRLDDKAAWVARIAKGNEVLIRQSIEGFKGYAGYMPARGGYMSLSDDDISQVVLYMVSQAR